MPEKLEYIVVNDRPLRDCTEDVLQSLYRVNIPEHIFICAGKLSRITVDEKRVPIIERLDRASLKGCIARSCNCVKVIKKKNGELGSVDVPPPQVIVEDCLSLGEWEFPAIIGITEVPVVRPDGTILTKSGYDKLTKLYYYPSPNLTMPRIPNKPTYEDVEKSKNLVLEVITDFPFDCAASRANAIAAMFTPILRPMIDGCVPMSIFDKPQSGTGASLIAEVMSLVATGRRSPMISPTRNDEEMRKLITSLLSRGQTVATIDNVELPLYSPSLALLLTSWTWRDRILGRSEDIILQNCLTWSITGNNVQLRGDLPRRCIWIRMDAKMSRPWLRNKTRFKHPNLIDWVSENRGYILAAILTIIRAWVVAGKPKATNLPSLGSFERYCDVVGGILASMGSTGFLNNINAMYAEADVETPEWEEFLEVWHDTVGDTSITVADISAKINSDKDLSDSLPESLGDKADSEFKRNLGKALAKHNGIQYPNGFSIVKDGTHRRAIKWRVKREVTSEGVS